MKPRIRWSAALRKWLCSAPIGLGDYFWPSDWWPGIGDTPKAAYDDWKARI